MNTGEDPESGARMIKATNLIYHDHDHPSALTVPVVPYDVKNNKRVWEDPARLRCDPGKALGI